MSKRYKCDFFESEECLLYYPREVKPEKPVQMAAFGSAAADAVCTRHPNGRNVVSISTKLAEVLGIPSFISSVCLFHDEDTFTIGPLVGIFSAGFTPYQVNPIGERSAMFSRLLSVQSSVGVVPFLFGEQHINWEQGMVEGFFFTEKGWERHVVPFPNVIYDRLPNRHSERMPTARKVRDKLEKEYLIPWYNPGFFNKLDIYEKLYSEHEAEPYLPETLPFSSYDDVERMLAQYGHVFIKPANGSAGTGIHQIILDPQSNAYYCRYADEKNRLQKYNSLEKLMKKVFAGKKLEGLLVQQGIRLLRINKRPVDFRVHANKDENGAWHISAIAAKAGGSGSPTTHNNAGGEILTLEEAFPEEAARKEHVRRMEEAALTLASLIENNVGGLIGEIGFDFGIDHEDRVWMFEANSKPGRQIFAHPGLADSDVLTRKLALSFAVHITEKSIRQPDEIFVSPNR